MQDNEYYHRQPEETVPEAEFFEVSSERIIDDFRDDLQEIEYKNRKLHMVSLGIYFFSFWSMLWFLWIPVVKRYSSLIEFSQSVPCFFFYCWLFSSVLIGFYVCYPPFKDFYKGRDLRKESEETIDKVLEITQGSKSQNIS